MGLNILKVVFSTHGLRNQSINNSVTDGPPHMQRSGEDDNSPVPMSLGYFLSTPVDS